MCRLTPNLNRKWKERGGEVRKGKGMRGERVNWKERLAVDSGPLSIHSKMQ